MAHIVINTPGTYSVNGGDTVEIDASVASIVTLTGSASPSNPAIVTVTSDVPTDFAFSIDNVSTVVNIATVGDGSGDGISLTARYANNIDQSNILNVGDGAHVQYVQYAESNRGTDFELNSGDDVSWGESATATRTVVDYLPKGRFGNSLRVDMGEDNVVDGTRIFFGSTSDNIDYVDWNGATINAEIVHLSGAQEAGRVNRDGTNDGEVYADNITVTGDTIYASGAQSSEVFLRGLTHNPHVGGHGRVSMVALFPEQRSPNVREVLHFGGDLTSDDSAYEIIGNNQNSLLDFQYIDEAQKQEFIDAFVAAGGTYDPTTETFGPATGLTWQISQRDTDGGMQEFTWWTEVSLTPLAPVCFCAGTMIKTIRGEVAIENLRVDDMVLTMDAGYQPIRWIGSRKLSSSLLNSFPKLRPIRILAGAMGQNMPERDLLVSRQHRMLVKSRISERMFESPEVLIPAIKLCAMPGIYVDVEVEEVEYFHMLFDTHQVVYANGSPSESLYTGTEALKALSPEAREEITTLFPEICAPDFVPTAAREIPSGKRQKKLLERHLKSAKHQLIA